MGEWKATNIGGVTSLVTKGTTPPNGKGFVDVGVNYIKSDALNYDGRIDTSLFVAIDTQTHNTFKRSQIKAGDILFSMAGAFLGKSGIATEAMLPANTNQAVAIIRPDPSVIDSTYLGLYFRQKGIIDFVNNLSGQSAQPNINFEEIKSLELMLPELPEQRAIASVLSSLDAKIDLLHRQNKTLEAMAETLFRQWFVEEAEEGWEDVLLSDLVEVRYGKDHKALGEGSIPVYGSGGVMRYAARALFKGESVLIPRKGTLNNVMYVNEAFWTVDTMFFTEMKRPNLAKFIYHFMKTHDLAAMNVGSAVPSMTTAVLNNMPLQIPGPDVFAKYETTIGPIYAKHAANTEQITSLTKLRDTLLPKLMSGEVRADNPME